MNWKQFFKPDWRKIVMTAIGIFVLVVYLMNPKSAMKADVWGIIIIFVWPLLLFGRLLGYLIDNEGFLQFYLIFGSIVCLIYFYSISCIIIWFDDRKKKKK